MFVNGTAESVGLLSMSFFGLNTLWSGTSLPSIGQFGPFNNMQGIFSDVAVGGVDALFSLSAASQNRSVTVDIPVGTVPRDGLGVCVLETPHAGTDHDGSGRPETPRTRFYAGRAVVHDRHHRRARGALVAGDPGGREAARRMSCANNLKQIGLALLNYEGTQGIFPVGARDQFIGTATFGMSWWVAIMPYLEQSALYRSLDQTGPYNGWPLMHPGNAVAVNQVLIPGLTCPSSLLEPLYPVGSVMILMPSYVGIAGRPTTVQFPEPRVSTCCLPVLTGQISAGGVLIPNEHVRGEQIVDGRSNCLAVGECSDYAIDSVGAVHRVDGGFPNGWLTGTSVAGTPPLYTAGIASPSWNITTIRDAPNMRDYTQPGIHDDHGANNPLLSSHPGGVEGLILDGSVRLLATNTDIVVLSDWQLAMMVACSKCSATPHTTCLAPLCDCVCNGQSQVGL